MLELYSYGDFHGRAPWSGQKAPAPARTRRSGENRMPTDKKTLFSLYRRPASAPSLLRPWRPDVQVLVSITEVQS